MPIENDDILRSITPTSYSVENGPLKLRSEALRRVGPEYSSYTYDCYTPGFTTVRHAEADVYIWGYKRLGANHERCCFRRLLFTNTWTRPDGVNPKEPLSKISTQGSTCLDRDKNVTSDLLGRLVSERTFTYSKITETKS